MELELDVHESRASWPWKRYTVEVEGGGIVTITAPEGVADELKLRLLLPSDRPHEQRQRAEVRHAEKPKEPVG